MLIKSQQLGRRAPLLEDWSITFPPEWADGGEPLTLRVLIARVVRAEVGRFRRRQAERSTMRLMTQAQIEDEAARGRVIPGQSQTGVQQVDEEAAVGTAWQAFEDGLYMVLIDGRPARALDEQIHLNEESVIVFLRLVMLAGG